MKTGGSGWSVWENKALVNLSACRNGQLGASAVSEHPAFIPCNQRSWTQLAGQAESHSPQLVSSLMSLQSGLLSHRYSIRMHVPSPHLCSSDMQGLMTGVTKRERGGGAVLNDMQAKATVRPGHSTPTRSDHSTNKTKCGEKLQYPGATAGRHVTSASVVTLGKF